MHNSRQLKYFAIKKIAFQLKELQRKKSPVFKKQVWHWPYETPGIVYSGLYDITIVCGPKDMSLEKYFLISQKIYTPWLFI